MTDERRDLEWYKRHCIAIDERPDGSVRFVFHDGSGETLTKEQYRALVADGLVKRYSRHYWTNAGVLEDGDGAPVTIQSIGVAAGADGAPEAIFVHYAPAASGEMPNEVLPRTFEGLPVEYRLQRSKPNPL